MTRVSKAWRMTFLTGLMALALLLIVGPALAQEGEVQHTNYASALFRTDSMVGNVVIWSLIVCSVALMSAIIQAALQNRQAVFMPPQLVETLDNLISTKKYREALDAAAADKSPFGRMMHWALNNAARGYDAMEEALFEMGDNIGNDRVRGLIWMEIAGAAGPMMGLFGTVYGMILAFTEMVAAGGAPKPAELAGGIATALVCTFWGLVVGIPGVIAAAIFRVRIERITARSISEGQRLLSVFRPGAVRSSSSSSSKDSSSSSRRKPAPIPTA